MSHRQLRLLSSCALLILLITGCSEPLNAGSFSPSKSASITSMSPGTVTAGANGFTLRITGSNFHQQHSVLYWRGSARSTLVTSATTLEAQILSSDVAVAGTAAVTVIDRRTGVVSNQVQFQILAAPTNARPVVTATATPTSGAVPLPVQFSANANDSDGSIVALTWNFGDGTSSTSPVTSHTYSAAGAYVATVTVKDNAGATATASINISAGAGTSQGCTKTIYPGTGVLQPALTALKAGEVLCLRGGIYKTGGAFGTSADTTTFATSGTATAPLTVKAVAGEVPIIQGQFKINGSYVRISGLTFEGPLSRDQASATERRANLVEFSYNHDVVFEGNTVRKSDYHAGIFLRGVYNIQIRRCYVHSNGRFLITNDPSTGAYTWNVDHGIYWGSTSGGGNLVSDSLFVNNRGYGVHLYPNTTDVTVVQNTMVYNGNSGLIVSGSGSDRATVINNISAFNSRNSQIRIMNGGNSVVKNNLTWSATSSLAGIENRTTSVVTGNRIANPNFRSTSDFRLLLGSPAIDIALPTYMTVIDYLGTTRPKGSGPDLGAFEFVP